MVWEDQRKPLNEVSLSRALKDELELIKKGGAGESKVGYVSSRGTSLLGDAEITSITGIWLC